MPFDDGAYDVVIVADVLHHEEDDEALLRECSRVAARHVVLKDHRRQGVLAQSRISFIDWAANAPYGVPCLFRYRTSAEWRDVFTRNGLDVHEELESMHLYPVGVNLLFGRGLHYLAVLEERRS